MTSINLYQLKAIQTAFKLSLKIEDRQERLEILSSYVGRSISTTKDLTEEEGDFILSILKGDQTQYSNNFAFFDQKNKQHKMIMSLLLSKGKTVIKNNNIYPDMGWLGNFLLSKKSPVKKSLKEMNKRELSTLIHVLEKF